MASTPPPKPSVLGRLASRAVLLSPFALVGVGLGLALGVGWGCFAAGALLYHDMREPAAPPGGKP